MRLPTTEIFGGQHFLLCATAWKSLPSHGASLRVGSGTRTNRPHSRLPHLGNLGDGGGGRAGGSEPELFWRIWDRLLDGLLERAAGIDTPESDSWVGLAIESPGGRSGDHTPGRNLRQGARGKPRVPGRSATAVDRLVANGPIELRLARVILASRLIYLSAIDHDWVESRLIPYFAWGISEDEAVALWQGYAWQGRISAALWAALRDEFFDCFSERRLARLGRGGETLAGLLMAVGVELPEADVPSGPSRTAISVDDTGHPARCRELDASLCRGA